MGALPSASTHGDPKFSWNTATFAPPTPGTVAMQELDSAVAEEERAVTDRESSPMDGPLATPMATTRAAAVTVLPVAEEETEETAEMEAVALVGGALASCTEAVALLSSVAMSSRSARTVMVATAPVLLPWLALPSSASMPIVSCLSTVLRTAIMSAPTIASQTTSPTVMRAVFAAGATAPALAATVWPSQASWRTNAAYVAVMAPLAPAVMEAQHSLTCVVYVEVTTAHVLTALVFLMVTPNSILVEFAKGTEAPAQTAWVFPTGLLLWMSVVCVEEMG